METKTYIFGGRPRVAVRIASCKDGVYTNYTNQNTKTNDNEKVYA